MANKLISELPEATTVEGVDLVEIQKSGENNTRRLLVSTLQKLLTLPSIVGKNGALQTNGTAVDWSPVTFEQLNGLPVDNIELKKWLDRLIAIEGLNFYGTQLVEGSLIWDSGFKFNVSPLKYYINNELYTSSPAKTVTLLAADATYPRIDAIIADIAGDVGKITGTPAEFPVYPFVDPATQILLRWVIVPENSTQPVIDVDTVYDENTEWTTSFTGTGTMDFNSTDAPFSGSKCAKLTSVTTGDRQNYTKASTKDIDGCSLYFMMRTNKVWQKNSTLVMYCQNNGFDLGNGLSLRSGLFGFDSSLLNTWQLVIIPYSQWRLGSTVLDRMSFYFAGNWTSGTNVSLDLIAIQTQSPQPVIKITETDPIFGAWLLLNPVKQNVELRLLSDDATTGDGTDKIGMVIPIEMNGYVLSKAHAAVTSAGVASSVSVQLKVGANDLLSTPITIDANELTSYTAATPHVIDPAHSAMVTGDYLLVSWTSSGTTGLILILTFTKPV